MNTMQAGANIAVNPSDVLDIVLSWLPQTGNVDVGAFALNAMNKVRSDSDFLYLTGDIETQGEFMTLSLTAGKPVFQIQVNKIPADIQKVVFAIASVNSLAALQQLSIEVKNTASFSPEQHDLQSLVLGELYLRNGQWKFRALGQGYQQGMDFLATQFGTQFNRDRQSLIPPVNPPVITESNQVLDTLKDELPDVKQWFKPDNIRANIRTLKTFSWGWFLSSLVVFIIAEISIAGLFETNIFVSFIPMSFRYLVEVVSMSLSFLVGGLIVGLISPSVRVLEPAIAAFISVILMLSNGFFTPHSFVGFSFVKMLIGGGIAFALAMYGARLGEKLEAMLGNKKSQEYINNRQ